MHARNRHTDKLSAGDKRMFVLAYLIPLRNVRIEITFAVEFAKVCRRTTNCRTDTQNMLHRFAVDDRKRAGVCEADRTHVHIRPRLVGVVRGVAEHLGSRLQFGMYFKPYGRTIHCLHSMTSLGYLKVGLKTF